MTKSKNSNVPLPGREKLQLWSKCDKKKKQRLRQQPIEPTNPTHIHGFLSSETSLELKARGTRRVTREAQSHTERPGAQETHTLSQSGHTWRLAPRDSPKMVSKTTSGTTRTRTSRRWFTAFAACF